MNAIPRRAKPELALAVQFASGAGELPPRWRLRRWVRAALEKKLALTLRFVDEDEGRALNRDFRDQDHATNVLTFVYADLPKRGALEGDIVICGPVLKREAKAQGRTLEAHCAHLVIHGVLHLQGWDHQGRAEAEEMEAREAELLRRFGYENPYA
jgi:probable rRNA maturation factor